jgi:hypothetical protein
MSRPRPQAVVHPPGVSYQTEKVPARWTPENLLRQGLIDLKWRMAWLWDGREEFHDQLLNHISYIFHGKLNDKGHLGMFHIIEVNIGLKAQRAEKEQAERAKTLPFVPAAPPVEAAEPVAPPAVPPLDSYLRKSDAAQTLGLTAAQFARLSRSPGFPAPIPRDALPGARQHEGPRLRNTDVYSSLAIQGYYAAHRDKIERLKDDGIARLQAQIDKRKAAKTAS